MCWLAGPFCQNLPLSTNDLKDGVGSSGILCRDLFCGTGTFWEGTGSSFLVQTKGLGDGGRSEEKRRCAVNLKQKLTTNLFLVGSFLTCWLAGHSAKISPYSTNDLEDGGRINRILAGNCLEGQEFFGEEREVLSLYKPKIWGVGAD